MSGKHVFIFLLAIFISLPGAHASGMRHGMTVPLSLEAALQQAFQRNPRMQEARAEIQAAEGRRWQAEALPDPEVELSIGGLKDGGAKTDQMVFRQPFDQPGTRFLRASIAKDNVAIRRGGLLSVWGDVRVDVTALYYRILAEQKALEIAEENLDMTRQFFTRVETRYQSGDALQTELIRARLEVSGAENALLVAQKNLRVAKGHLNLELGQEIETVLELSEALEYRPFPYRLSEAREHGRLHRADLQSEKIRLASRKKSIWRSWLEMIFPAVSIGVERTTEEFENDTSLIVEASYPLWGFNLGEVREAQAEKYIQEIRLDALEKNISLQIYESYLEAELAEKQIQLQKDTVLESNELLRQITIQYDEGKMAFIAYLENIQTIKQARLAYYQVLQSYHAKVAALEQAIQATPLLEEN